MKLGSLFDGSGGFPLAGTLCGITPVWAAEVEPYPIAVTRSRFPKMKHLGDVSKVNGAEIEPVDIITFGSPCQDLSVAGKRKGLKHETNGDDETTRSGLFMEAVRIIKEMRNATNGVYPAFIIWENVPGAYSSNSGNDFRIVLEELAKIRGGREVSIPRPPKWEHAGCILGDDWSIAWRTLDAQYWGVPQRRRRIYLVADFRGQRAGQVLFERTGLRRNFTESKQERQGAAAVAERSPGASYTLKIRSGCAGGGKGALVQTEQSATLATNNDQYLFQPVFFEDQGGQQMGEVYGSAPTSRAEEHGHQLLTAYGVCSYASNAMKSSNPNSGFYKAETSRTLDINGGNPSCNQGGMIVIEGNGPRDSHRGDGYSESETMYTLNTIERHGVCYPIENHPQDSCVTLSEDGVVQTLTKQMGTGGGNVPMIISAYSGDVAATLDASYYKGPGARNGKEREFIAFASQSYSELIDTDVSSTLKAKGGSCHGGSETLIVENQQDVSIDCRNLTETGGISGTLQAKSNGGYSLNFVNPVRLNYIVRRLTPTECARLQGFPDDWGHPDKLIDFTREGAEFWQGVFDTHAAVNGKPEHKYSIGRLLQKYNSLHTDSAEYKMWGNGIALPTALYVMEGIAKELEEQA